MNIMSSLFRLAIYYGEQEKDTIYDIIAVYHEDKRSFRHPREKKLSAIPHAADSPQKFSVSSKLLMRMRMQGLPM